MNEVIIALVLLVLSICIVCYVLSGSTRHEHKKREMVDYITPNLGKIIWKLRNSFRSVLIVDDDEIQQDLIRHNMIPPDCKVHVAKSKDEAIELIHGNEYDLILLDIKLIGENGGNVLKTMRAEGNETSVVIITGYADSQVYDMSIQYDAPIIEKQHLFTHFNAWSKAFLGKT